MFFLLLTMCSAIKFDLEQAQEMCMGESVLSKELFVGEYSVTPDNALITVRVTDPLGATVHHKLDSSAGKFAQTANHKGSYRACFANQYRDRITVSVDLRKGVDAKDYTDFATVAHLQPIELELKRMEDMATQIKRELEDAKERHLQSWAISDATDNRILFFSFFSLVVLVALSGGQLVCLKRMFRQKQMID